MSVADESIHLHLLRHGDSWSLNAARHGEGYSPLRPHPDLDPDARAESLEADSPGRLLELIGQRLDRREAKRMTDAVMGAGLFARTEPEPLPPDLAEDVARVLEVLESHAAAVSRSTLAITQSTGWSGADAGARAARALEQAERDGAVVHRAEGRIRYWRLRPADEQRDAAGDDPRGEADR